MANGKSVIGLRKRFDFLDGEYEGGRYGSGSMRSFYDDKREILLRMVNEPEKLIGSREFEWFLFDIVFLFELVSHIFIINTLKKIKVRRYCHFRWDIRVERGWSAKTSTNCQKFPSNWSTWSQY